MNRENEKKGYLIAVTQENEGDYIRGAEHIERDRTACLYEDDTGRRRRRRSGTV